MIKAYIKPTTPDQKRRRKKLDRPGQEQFHLPDESPFWAMSVLGARCPLCGSVPALWRLVREGKVLFQVACPYAHRKSSYDLGCAQPPIPAEPTPNSEKAVAAWKLMVKLSS